MNHTEMTGEDGKVPSENEPIIQKSEYGK